MPSRLIPLVLIAMINDGPVQKFSQRTERESSLTFNSIEILEPQKPKAEKVLPPHGLGTDTVVSFPILSLYIIIFSSLRTCVVFLISKKMEFFCSKIG